MDELEKLNEFASKTTALQIAQLSDKEIKNLAIDRPGHPGQVGFLLDYKRFKSPEHMAAIMSGLLKRLELAEKRENERPFSYNIANVLYAARIATDVHEVDQKQKRKGKDEAYIGHPLQVGLILALLSASEDVVVAGILHDVIEDSIPEKKMTREFISEKFGEHVAELVMSVTEEDKSLSWEARKQKALQKIETYSSESALIKYADTSHNVLELLDDHSRDGDKVFERFNAPKERTIQNYLQVIRAIVEREPDFPPFQNLAFLASQLQLRSAPYFMRKFPAPIIEYKDYDGAVEQHCPVCGWHGIGIENTDSHYALEVNCPICDKMVLVVSYPSA